MECIFLWKLCQADWRSFRISHCEACVGVDPPSPFFQTQTQLRLTFRQNSEADLCYSGSPGISDLSRISVHQEVHSAITDSLEVASAFIFKSGVICHPIHNFFRWHLHARLRAHVTRITRHLILMWHMAWVQTSRSSCGGPENSKDLRVFFFNRIPWKDALDHNNHPVGRYGFRIRAWRPNGAGVNKRSEGENARSCRLICVTTF